MSSTEKVPVYRQRPDGSLECAYVTFETKRDLVNDMGRLDRYFNAIANKAAESLNADGEAAFHRQHNRVKCLYCLDIGYLDTKFWSNYLGREEVRAIRCVCRDKPTSVGSVHDLMLQGLYDLVCAFGIEYEGRCACPLKQKEMKCRAFTCPKFDRKAAP